MECASYTPQNYAHLAGLGGADLVDAAQVIVGIADVHQEARVVVRVCALGRPQQ